MPVHLINYGYDDGRDAVARIPDLDLTVRDGDGYLVRLADVGLYTVVVLR